jgi:uncharacterized protein YndB with AHSA1/START domain
MANITHKIATPAAVSTVRDALTTVAGLSGWWTSDTSGDPGAGGTLRFRFGGQGPDMRVEQNDDHRVLWRVVAGPQEWLETTVEFRLEDQDDGKTALYFAHAGWAGETPFHYHCSMKWASFLLSLKQYVELGQGRPFPDDIQIEEAAVAAAA